MKRRCTNSIVGFLLALAGLSGCTRISGSEELYRELLERSRNDETYPVFFNQSPQYILQSDAIARNSEPYRESWAKFCFWLPRLSIDGRLFVCRGRLGGDDAPFLTDASLIATSGKLLHRIVLPLEWRDATPVPGGKTIYFSGVYPKGQAGARFGLFRWDVARPATLEFLGDPTKVPGVTGKKTACDSCMSSDAAGNVLVQAKESIVIFRVQTGAMELLAQGIAGAWSPDGHRVAYRTLDDQLVVKDIASGRILTPRRARINFRPAWSPDGLYLAYFVAGPAVEFFRIRDGARVRVYVGGFMSPRLPSNLGFLVLR